MRTGGAQATWRDGTGQQANWAEPAPYGRAEVWRSRCWALVSCRSRSRSGVVPRHCHCRVCDHCAGEWVDGKMHGQGTLAMINGDVYDGEWAHDCKEGYGVHQYADNSKYEGTWREDKQHGKGTLTTSDTSR